MRSRREFIVGIGSATCATGPVSAAKLALAHAYEQATEWQMKPFKLSSDPRG